MQHDELSEESFDNEVVKLFNGKFAEAIANLPEEIKRLSEEELHERVNPTANDWKLRQNFTDAVKEAKKLQQEFIATTRIYEDIMSKQGFHNTILPSPLKVAWIVRPIVEHTAFYNAIHREALAKIYRIIKTLPDDSKYLPQILKIAETAGNRVHGPVVQRMQIHSKNLNVEVDAKQLPPVEGQEDLNKRIEQMQAKLLEGPKDVTNTSKE